MKKSRQPFKNFGAGKDLFTLSCLLLIRPEIPKAFKLGDKWSSGRSSNFSWQTERKLAG